MPLSTNEPPAPLMVAPTIHHRATQQAFCDISLVIEAAREQPVYFLSVGNAITSVTRWLVSHLVKITSHNR